MFYVIIYSQHTTSSSSGRKTRRLARR